MKKIIGIFDYRNKDGILDLLTKALGRASPVASRRYDTIWDIDQLLSWMRANWGANDVLNDHDLQTKTMLLVMIFSACRLAELGRMERPDLEGPPGVSIVLYTITKQSHEKKRRIVVRRISNEALCPVTTLYAWLERTESTKGRNLFYDCTSMVTGKLVPRVSREITTPGICTRFLAAMQDAGIAPHYKAYSVKHAVVTKLFKMGATDEQVNAYGGWAPGSHTARKWYYIETLEEEWLGAKLVGEILGDNPNDTLEEFLETYLPVARTEEQASVRAAAMESLVGTEPRRKPSGRS
jgi:integrase